MDITSTLTAKFGQYKTSSDHNPVEGSSSFYAGKSENSSAYYGSRSTIGFQSTESYAFYGKDITISKAYVDLIYSNTNQNNSSIEAYLTTKIDPTNVNINNSFIAKAIKINSNTYRITFPDTLYKTLANYAKNGTKFYIGICSLKYPRLHFSGYNTTNEPKLYITWTKEDKDPIIDVLKNSLEISESTTGNFQPIKIKEQGISYTYKTQIKIGNITLNPIEQNTTPIFKIEKIWTNFSSEFPYNKTSLSANVVTSWTAEGVQKSVTKTITLKLKEDGAYPIFNEENKIIIFSGNKKTSFYANNFSLIDWSINASGRANAKIISSSIIFKEGDNIILEKIFTHKNQNINEIKNIVVKTNTLHLNFENEENSKTINYTMTVMDSRGKKTSNDFSFIFYNYTPLIFKGLSAVRCDSDGTINEIDGYYFSGEFSFNKATIFNTSNTSPFNSPTFTYNLKIIQGENSGSFTEENNNLTISSDKTTYTFKTNNSWSLDSATFKLTYSEKYTINSEEVIFSSAEKTMTVSGAHFLMYFPKGSRSLGIGGIVDNDYNTNSHVKINLPLRLENPLSIEYGGTGSSNFQGARINLGIDLDFIQELLSNGFQMKKYIRFNYDANDSDTTYRGVAWYTRENTKGEITTFTIRPLNEEALSINCRVGSNDSIRIVKMANDGSVNFPNSVTFDDTVTFNKLSTANIQTGTEVIKDVSAGGFKDATVNFNSSFSSPPFVMLCGQASAGGDETNGTTDGTSGGLLPVIYTDSIKAGSFRIRLYNNSSSQRSLGVRWMAFLL